MMKFIFFSISILNFGLLLSQSRKEQIEILKKKLDSIIIIKNYENITNIKQIQELKILIENKEKEKIDIQKDLQIKINEIDSYKRLLQLKSDSINFIYSEIYKKQDLNPYNKFNYDSTTRLYHEFSFPMGGNGTYRELISPLGWSSDSCFYYLSELIGAPIGKDNPDFFCFCKQFIEEKKITPSLNEYLIGNEQFEDNNVNELVEELINRKKIKMQSDFKIIESTSFVNSNKFSKIITSRDKNKTKYYLQKSNGDLQFLKQFNQEPSEWPDGVQVIIGDGKYIGYLKSPFDEVYLLVFADIDHGLGGEHENICTYSFYYLK
jgi:hypothetical protein